MQSGHQLKKSITSKQNQQRKKITPISPAFFDSQHQTLASMGYVDKFLEIRQQRLTQDLTNLQQLFSTIDNANTTGQPFILNEAQQKLLDDALTALEQQHDSSKPQHQPKNTKLFALTTMVEDLQKGVAHLFLQSTAPRSSQTFNLPTPF